MSKSYFFDASGEYNMNNTSNDSKELEKKVKIEYSANGKIEIEKDEKIEYSANGKIEKDEKIELKSNIGFKKNLKKKSKPYIIGTDVKEVGCPINIIDTIEEE